VVARCRELQPICRYSNAEIKMDDYYEAPMI